jgi:hypothetical protein
MNKTAWKDIGNKERMRVEYGMHTIGKQAPYFSITAEQRGPRGFEAGGCLHDEIRKHFPELAPLIRWHLWDHHGPMHYSANAIFFLQLHYGVAEYCQAEDSGKDWLSVFKSHIGFDLLPSDKTAFEALKGTLGESPDRNTIREHTANWLEQRKHLIVAAFDIAMAQ